MDLGIASQMFSKKYKVFYRNTTWDEDKNFPKISNMF